MITAAAHRIAALLPVEDRTWLELRAIARDVSRAVRAPSSLREDVAGEVLIQLRLLLPKVQAGHPAARAYLVRSATRAAWAAVEKLGRDRRRMAALPSLGPNGEGGPASGLSDRSWTLRDEADAHIHRTSEKMRAAAAARRPHDPLKWVVRELGKLRQAAAGADADTIDAIKWMVVPLQEHHHALTGRYLVMELPGVRYTRERRIQEVPNNG